jgi:flagellar basal-body rod modification protein FlgD
MADVVVQPQGLSASGLSIGGIAGNLNSNTAAASQSLNQTYDNFLKMLTTQLKNQDPLNPMDSKDFTSQLIQMSAAEQSIAQTSRIEDMLKLMQASTVNTALNYIGLSVDYEGNSFAFDGMVPADITYELPENAAQTQISVLNSEGKVVYSATGETTAGQHKFSWGGTDKDGNKQKAGTYTVEIGSQTSENKALQNKISVPGTVSGVETADGQVYLVINGEKVTIDAVKSAYAMTYYYPPTTGNGDTSGTGTSTGSGTASTDTNTDTTTNA